MFNDYIESLIKEGKCCFSNIEAITALGKSKKSIQSSIEHLLAKEKLVSPAKGFYVIVSPEYHKLGCLPPSFFLPYLMKYLGLNYYVCLLSASSYYGASHQAVQTLQVMVDKKRSSIVCGQIKIKFITKNDMSKTLIQTFNTPKSIINVSTPEETMIDLLNYIKQSGGLNHIATVIAELHESIDQQKFKELVYKHPLVPWKQRLGYILECLDLNELACVVDDVLRLQKRVDYVPLSPGIKGEPEINKNTKWKILENSNIESDL